jgi:hypothetical protein
MTSRWLSVEGGVSWDPCTVIFCRPLPHHLQPSEQGSTRGSRVFCIKEQTWTMKRKLKIIIALCSPRAGCTETESKLWQQHRWQQFGRGEKLYAARQCRPNQRPRLSSFPVCSLTVGAVGGVVWCSVGFLWCSFGARGVEYLVWN